MPNHFLQNLSEAAQLFAPLAKGGSAQSRAEENAAIDRADAAVVIGESRKRANLIRRQGRRRAATQRTITAASGFTQEGTLELQLDQIEAAEFNALEELRVGSAQQQRLLQSASLNVQRGRTAKRSAVFETLGVGAQLLGKRRKKAATLKQFD